MARTKLVYPKMPGSDAAPLERCIAFDKYDGSNLFIGLPLRFSIGSALHEPLLVL